MVGIKRNKERLPGNFCVWCVERALISHLDIFQLNKLSSEQGKTIKVVVSYIPKLSFANDDHDDGESSCIPSKCQK